MSIISLTKYKAARNEQEAWNRLDAACRRMQEQYRELGRNVALFRANMARLQTRIDNLSHDLGSYQEALGDIDVSGIRRQSLDLVTLMEPWAAGLK